MDEASRRHQWQLLQRRRCRLCAEAVERDAILSGEACPHCGEVLCRDPNGLRKGLERRRRRWRLKGYGLMALASGGAGLVPLAQSVVQVAAMVILHLIVLRQSVKWLSLKRRLLTRVKLRLLAATLAVVSVVINITVAPFLGLSAAVLAVVGPVLTAIYVESGVAMVERGLRRDTEGEATTIGEWIVPVMAVMALVVSVGLLVAALGSALHWLSTLEWPALETTLEWLVEVLP